MMAMLLRATKSLPASVLGVRRFASALGTFGMPV